MELQVKDHIAKSGEAQALWVLPVGERSHLGKQDLHGAQTPVFWPGPEAGDVLGHEHVGIGNIQSVDPRVDGAQHGQIVFVLVWRPARTLVRHATVRFLTISFASR